MIWFILGLVTGGILVYLTLSHEIKGLSRQIAISRGFKTLTPIQVLGSEPSLNALVYEINNLLHEYYDVIKLNESMLRQLKQMTTSIAHDFRTPLTSMLGYVQLVSESDISEKDRARLILIENRIKVLNNHVEDFYMLSQLNSEEYPLHLQTDSPIRLLEETLALYYDALNQHFSSIDIMIAEEPVKCTLDAAAFNRILGNLIKNTLNHGSHTLSIATKKSEHQLDIIITNGGASDTLDLDRIFERTYQESSNRTNRSSGLGLSIAYELAKVMDMSLTATKENDRISFNLSIPLI